MRKNNIFQEFIIVLTLLAIASAVSALEVTSVDTPNLNPGGEGLLNIEGDNILSDDVTDVSLKLNFENLPFIPLGTSEQSIDEIQEDDEENFIFRIKANSNTITSDYEIPYTLKYEV